MVRQLLAVLACSVFLGLVGCGGGLSTAEGIVTLDGTPVEGASVTYAPVDKGKEAFGVTDANGRFSLKTGNKSGANPGEYTVTVTKTKAFVGGEGIKPGTPEFMKMMQDKSKTTGGKPGGPPGGPPGVGPGGGGPGGTKSELPAVYAGEKTPFKFKIPHSGLMKLELDSKAK